MRSWWRHGGGWPRLRLRTRRCTSKRSRADLHSNLHGGGCSAAGAGGEAPRRDGARKPQVPAKRSADAAAGPRRDRPPITANPAAAGTANPPHQRLRPERAAALPSPCGAREPGNSDERCSDGDDCKSEESGGSGRNDDCCHRSHKGGKVLCCSGVVCYRAWHALCLPADAMDTTGTGDDWEVPGLQGEFRVDLFCNPLKRRGRGRPKQARLGHAPHIASKANGLLCVRPPQAWSGETKCSWWSVWSARVTP